MQDFTSPQNLKVSLRSSYYDRVATMWLSFLCSSYICHLFDSTVLGRAAELWVLCKHTLQPRTRFSAQFWIRAVRVGFRFCWSDSPFLFYKASKSLSILLLESAAALQFRSSAEKTKVLRKPVELSPGIFGSFHAE